MRLACARGTDQMWDDMAAVLEQAVTGSSPVELLAIDRRCRELVWEAADNRFLTDQLDMLYAHSDRLWHLYLGDVADLHGMIAEHREILDGQSPHAVLDEPGDPVGLGVVDDLKAVRAAE